MGNQVGVSLELHIKQQNNKSPRSHQPHIKSDVHENRVYAFSRDLVVVKVEEEQPKKQNEIKGIIQVTTCNIHITDYIGIKRACLIQRLFMIKERVRHE